MLRRSVLAFTAITALACDETHAQVSVSREPVTPLQTSAATEESRPDFVSRVAQLEARAKSLSAEWRDIEREYERAGGKFRDAERTYRTVSTEYAQASKQFRQAKDEWEAAKTRWQFFQTLVMIAAAVDAANIERFRELSGRTRIPSTNCSSGMSTSSYRRHLQGEGVDLRGMDIDHIVPRSLGGADHPANYQVLSASANRSLGATWDTAKCRGAGLGVCAAAMAVSKKCGSFSGPFF